MTFGRSRSVWTDHLFFLNAEKRVPFRTKLHGQRVLQAAFAHVLVAECAGASWTHALPHKARHGGRILWRVWLPCMLSFFARKKKGKGSQR